MLRFVIETQKYTLAAPVAEISGRRKFPRAKTCINNSSEFKSVHQKIFGRRSTLNINGRVLVGQLG